MEIKIKGQVKSTFWASEKRKSYISCFDEISSSDVNFTMDGETELVKGTKLDHVMMVETSVYKGMNTLLIRSMIPVTAGK
jgi:hypothetical protein